MCATGMKNNLEQVCAALSCSGNLKATESTSALKVLRTQQCTLCWYGATF